MQASRKLIQFAKPYWHWATLAPLSMAVEVAMDLMQPRLLQRIIDQGIARSNLTLVFHTGAWMIALAVLGLAAGMACTFFSVLAAQGAGTDLRRGVFAKIESLSFGNLDTLETGGLITRLTNDVSQIQDVFMMLLRVMVRMPLLLVGSLIMAVLTSPKLSLLFIVLMPLVLVTLVLIIRRTFPIFGLVQKRLDGLNTVIQENLAGVRVVKAFARANYEKQRFGEANDRLMAQNIIAVRLSAVTMPFMMLSINLGVVAALWFGGLQVGHGELKVGQVIAFINYLMQTLMSVMMVSMLITRFSRAEASAQRVQEVMDTVPQVTNPPESKSIASPQGRIVFENVSFDYRGDTRDPVLKNVSFTAEPGQTVAILGATGSGKSSLVNLIPRFYDVTQGKVMLDGVDVRDLSEDTLRANIGMALQESILFSGTIRDNIRYGRPDANENAVIAAAKMAQADDFIRKFPDGYETVVGQRGVNLSGGQKQRIAIARALLINPSVLILDDSTSAVDVRTESRIQEALEQHHANQTRIVVAQRISTVIHADKILVLDDGAIAAEGTHRELLTTSPIYREIYESQTDNGVLAHVGE